MKVLVAEKCGFCPGVRNAINLAKKTLEKNDIVYSLGPIIHNEDVVRQLAKSGLHTVLEIENIPGGTVLIRSHGATSAELDEIKKKGSTLSMPPAFWSNGYRKSPASSTRRAIMSSLLATKIIPKSRPSLVPLPNIEVIGSRRRFR